MLANEPHISVPSREIHGEFAAKRDSQIAGLRASGTAGFVVPSDDHFLSVDACSWEAPSTPDARGLAPCAAGRDYATHEASQTAPRTGLPR